MSVGSLTFLHGGYLPHCAAFIDKRFDGYHTLQFAVGGGVEVAYADQRYLLPTGEAWFWPAFPGPRIRFHPAAGNRQWEHRYIAFRGSRVSRWATDGLLLSKPQQAPARLALPPPSSAVSGLLDYAARFDELLRLLPLAPATSTAPNPWSLARAVNLLEMLLIDLAEDRSRRVTVGVGDLSPSPPVLEPWLAELLEIIEPDNPRGGSGGDPDTLLDYEAFARQHGMALSTLRRRFRAAMGLPLHDWSVQARIARARFLLGETDHPVKAIAERLGYRDVYFFTRQFRQMVGVPPAAYRKTRQG